MSEGILGNATGGFGFPKTYIITDSDGNELTGVYVESETVFTATDNDVREGMVYASDSGVSVGQKEILEYRTTTGVRVVTPGSNLSIPLSVHNKYDYTKLQCIITAFNTSLSDSLSAEKVVINNAVYNVGSATKISDVTKNEATKSIDLNITNDANSNCYIRYFTYREEDQI